MAIGNKPRSPWTWIFRVSILAVLIFPLFFPAHFIQHFRAHLTGAIEGSIITGQWHVVLINILLFVSFLIPLSFRKKISWKEYGIVAAFFVSLFVEMYGIPLTIMFFSRTFDPSASATVDIIFTIRFLGVGFAFTLPMLYGSILMFLGTLIVVVAWATLYRNVEKVGLVTSGVYSISRHPQYLGFLVVILTVVFGIVLFAMYIRISLKEEKEMGKDHDYQTYKEKTPFML